VIIVVIVRYGIRITTLDVGGCVLESWFASSGPVAHGNGEGIAVGQSDGAVAWSIWQRLDMPEKLLYVFLAIA
jgi:hypothetical protein